MTRRSVARVIAATRLRGDRPEPSVVTSPGRGTRVESRKEQMSSCGLTRREPHMARASQSAIRLSL